MASKARPRPAQVSATPRTLQEAVDSYTADCRARSLSPCTMDLNRIILRSLLGFLGNVPLAGVSSSDLRRFLINKASATSSATAARYYDCINRMFAYLREEGFREDDPMTTVQKPKAPIPVIEPLSQAQVEALLETCGANFTGVRDRLALLILMDCGLRATELCNLTLSDVDTSGQQFLVKRGKGGRFRRVPFGSAVLNAFRHYMARRAEVDTPQLLVTVYGEPIDRYRLRWIVQRAARKAGVRHPRMGPHLLRHTCAVQYLRNGGDTFSLQKVLGHSTLTMTRRYAELTDTDVSNKHRQFSPADRLSPAATHTGKRRRLK